MNLLRTACFLCVLSHAAIASDTREAEVTSVVMQRSGCLGPCPVYTVQATSDLVVTFDGQFYVAARGHHTGRVARSEFSRLVDALNRIDFFSLHEQYDGKDC